MFGVLFSTTPASGHSYCLLLMTILGWARNICLSLRMMFYMLFLNFPKWLPHNLILRLRSFTLTMFVSLWINPLLKKKWNPPPNNVYIHATIERHSKVYKLPHSRGGLGFMLYYACSKMFLSWGCHDYCLSHQPSVYSCYWLSNFFANVITVSPYSFYFESLS